MSGLDLSRLSASDAVAALRSFPRRYRAEILPIPDDPSAEEWAYRVGPDGESAMDILDHTTRTLHLLTQALHQAMVSAGEVVLHPGVLDPSQRQFEGPTGTPEPSVEHALELFAEACEEMAAEIDRVHYGDWSRRTARIADGEQIKPFDIVTEAVRTGADNLARIRATMAAVRP